MICHICQREFSSIGGLHGHIKKSHEYSQENYYYEFEPRRDKFDDELIVYKNLEQYRKSDFNSRDNLIEWLNHNYKNAEAKKYCMGLLVDRATRKSYFTLPSHIELKSLLAPSLLGFEKLYGSLNNFLRELGGHGIKSRFDYNVKPEFKENGNLEIFVDTREQLPLNFSCKTSRIKVPCGDYCPNENYFHNVFLERKSLADLAGTLGLGLERFTRELDKAKEMGFYIVVMIECLFSDVLHYTSTNKYSKKMTGAHLTHTIRDLSQKYDNLQWVCAGNRLRAADLTEKIFRLGMQVPFLDIEFLKDKKLI